jgi:hypothetical protein
MHLVCPASEEIFEEQIMLHFLHIVKFDEVSVNEGNHFNSGDGIFVAPVSGTYQFSLTTLISSSQIAETELKVGK